MVKPLEIRKDIVLGRMRQSRRLRDMQSRSQDMRHSVWMRRRFTSGKSTLARARNCLPCYVGDNVYDSIGAAARAEGMKMEKLRVRLKRGATHYQGKPIGLIDLPQEVRDSYYGKTELEWEGEVYDTKAGYCRAVAATFNCSPNTVEYHMRRHGSIDQLGAYKSSRGFYKKTYHRATEKLAKDPVKVPKAKFRRRKPPSPLVPCSKIFFLGGDRFDSGTRIAPGLDRIVQSGGGVWQGAQVRVPQTPAALAVYEALLLDEGERS